MIAEDFISTEHRLGAHNYQPLEILRIARWFTVCFI